MENHALSATQDVAPLAWVIDEIRVSVHQTVSGVKAFFGNKQDIDSLRAARNQVHQANGALQLLDLRGVSLVTDAVEQTLRRWEAEPKECTLNAVRAVDTALAAVLAYLEGLLSGRPNQPIRLFPYYRDVQALMRAARAHPADLMFPDLSRRPAFHEIEVKPLTVDQLKQRRQRFEEGLLGFLRNAEDPRARRQMRDALADLEHLPLRGLARSFWWIVRGMVDALDAHQVPVDIDLKRVLARLNLQLRRLIEGGGQVAERLMTDALYYVSQADSKVARVSEIKQLYGLEALVPPDFERPTLTALDADALRALKEALAQAKTLWAQVVSATASDTVRFLQEIRTAREATVRLQSAPLVHVLAAIETHAPGIRSKSDGAREGLALEVASALLFIDLGVEQLPQTDAEYDSRAQAVAERLAGAAAGKVLPDAGPWMSDLSRRAQDRLTMQTVVAETQSTLRDIEQRLDRFFRNPVERGDLPATRTMFDQVCGVLSMLGYDEPVLALRGVQQAVAAFADPAVPVRPEEFGRVAQNLGAIGFFVETLDQDSERPREMFRYDPATGVFSADLGQAAAQATAIDADEASMGVLSAHLAAPPTVDLRAPDAHRIENVEASARQHLEHAHALAQRLLEQPLDAPAQQQLAHLLPLLNSEADLLDDADLKRRVARAVQLMAAIRGGDRPDLAAQLVAALAPPAPLAAPGLTAPLPASEAAASSELLDIFIEEANEVLDGVAADLPRLRRKPDDPDLLTAARRAFHTLKGSSRMVKLGLFGDGAWALEQCFNLWLSKEEPASPALLALADQASTLMRAWIQALGTNPRHAIDVDPLVQAAARVRAGEPYRYDGPPARAAGDVGRSDAPVFRPDQLPKSDGSASDESDRALPQLTSPQSTSRFPAAGTTPPLDPDHGGVRPVRAEGEASANDDAAVAPATVPGRRDPVADVPVTTAPLGRVAALFEPASDETAGPPSATARSDAGNDPAIDSGGGNWSDPYADPARTEPEIAGASGAIGPLGPIAAIPPHTLPADQGGPATSWHQVDFEVDARGDAAPAEPMVSGTAGRDPIDDLPPVPDPFADPFAAPLAAPLDAHLDAPLDAPLASPPAAALPLADDATDDLGALPTVLDPLEELLLGMARTGKPDGTPIMPPPTPAHRSLSAAAAAAAVAAQAAPPAAEPAPARGAAPLAEPGASIQAPFEAEPPPSPWARQDETRRVGPLEISHGLYSVFLNEADECVRTLGREFDEWRFEPGRPPTAAAVRCAHSLGGISATVGLLPVWALADPLDDVVNALAQENVPAGEPADGGPPYTGAHLRPDEFDVLDRVMERVRDMLRAFAAGTYPAEATEERDAIRALASRFSMVASFPPSALPVDETITLEPLAEDPDPDGADGAGAPPEPGAGTVSAAPPALEWPTRGIDALRGGATAERADIDVPHDGAGDAPDDQAVVRMPAATLGTAWPDIDVGIAWPATFGNGIAPGAPPPGDRDGATPPAAAPVADAATPAAARMQPPPQGAAAPAARATETPAVRDELDADLLPVFLVEAADHLPAIGGQLRALQAHPDDREVTRDLMRRLHTVKGSARMAGAMRLGELVHGMETRLEAATEQTSMPATLADALLAQHDQAMALFDALSDPLGYHAAQTAPAGTAAADDAAGLADLSAPLAGDFAPADGAAPDAPGATAPDPAGAFDPAAATLDRAPDDGAASAARPAGAHVTGAAAPPAAAMTQQFIRVRADVLDKLVDHAGEVSISRSKLENEVGTLRTSLTDLTENIQRLRTQLREVEIQADAQIQARTDQLSKEAAPFDPLEFDRYSRLQELTRLLAESVEDVAMVQSNMLKGLTLADNDLTAQSRLTRELQQQLMRVRLVQFQTVSERLYRVARQAAKETDKRIVLDIRGGNTEIDRGVLERMAAPFEHLVRNAIVHGLEKPAERVKRGKPETGELTFEVRQEGNEIVVTIADDGAGLDLERIRSRGVEKGLLGPFQTVTERELMELIFAPGFSTLTEVTELAGRGVGMDVVRSELSSFGGRIAVASDPGRGARFTLYLPLTLAVAQVVLATVGTRRYAIPAGMVEQVRRYRPAQIEAALREGVLAIAPVGDVVLRPLAQLVGDELPALFQKQTPVALLRSGEDRLAVVVDELSSNQEVVVKNIGPQVSRLAGILGATILGNGEIVLMVNPVQLISRAPEPPVLREPTAEAITAAARRGVRGPGVDGPAVIMVVDDSLTVRRVTQRLLERQGYVVLLAKDGVDALRQLQDSRPDVMLVDIEMPKMDGFDLTRNIRASQQTRSIPIIMITSRTAEKHRNVALEIGVNEYLGKPYQEDELVKLIKRYLAIGAAAAVN